MVDVDVPPLRYLMIDGEGDANTSAWCAHAVEALFSVQYTAKHMVERGPAGIDYAVMSPEGLWWSNDPSALERNDRTQWRWTMTILQPDAASDDVVNASLVEVKRKKGLPALDALRPDTFADGRCAQALQVGPINQEGPTVARVHGFIQVRGAVAGRRHETYLSDMRTPLSSGTPNGATRFKH